MKHLRKRLLAVFLAAVMLVTSVGTSSYAYEAEKKGNLSVTGNDGKTIEEEESWEEKFPNGTFAFKNDSITIEEGKNVKEQKITIYRLGGTKGKATAKVAITPAVAALDETKKNWCMPMRHPIRTIPLRWKIRSEPMGRWENNR